MKVLVTGAISYKEEDLQEIKKLGIEMIFIQDERKTIKTKVEDIDYVICNNLFIYNDIKKFSKLKYIQVTSAGMDRLPLEYIENKGIKVFNARGVYSVPMAEWTILKILEVYKKSEFFYCNQEKRKWEKNRNLLELTNKIVTILGYGSVGREIAKRLHAFGVKINIVDLKKEKLEWIEKAYDINELKEALADSDINIICLPLTKQTRGIINKKTISYMKEQSILINISRGEIIKEEELIEEISNNKFLSVILDVFEKEPLDSKSRLWDYKNVIITPHNSFVSEKNYERLIEVIYDNLKTILKEEIQ